MQRSKGLNSLIFWDMSNFIRVFWGICLLLVLSGCLGGESLNTETAEYTPEPRPLNVIAPDDIEVKPGDTVTLTSRLVGTVSNETLMWTQVGGATIDIADPTAETISFVVPMSVLSDKLVFEVSARDANGNPIMGDDGMPLKDSVEVTVFDPSSVLIFDVSGPNATLNGARLVEDGDDQYVAGAQLGIHTADLEPGQNVTFTIDNQTGFFTLNVRYVIPSDYGGKVANATVNGVTLEFQLTATGQWSEHRVGVIKLEEGLNTIEIGGGWNYYRIDSISLIPAAQPAEPLPVPATLVNANSQQTSLDLMTFLTENYASATLSGQTEFPQKEGDSFPLTEFNKILSATGDDAPAIVAFDYMNYSASYAGAPSAAEGLTESMISHHKSQNVILSALWHWRAPSGNTSSGDGSFYTDGTTFDLAAALADTSSNEYQQLIDDIDTIALELKKFADQDIPILWRPLHEAEGEWFWWGAAGADPLKALWVLMYERMTNMHGLNNLIWVFTHVRELSQDWYPGDEYVDIVGYDGYATPHNDPTATFSAQYKRLMERHNGKKMVALTETGTIPDVALMHEQNAWWSFFITWNSEVWDSSSIIGPQGADATTIDMNYAYDGLINLADIPGGVEKVEPGVYASFDVSTQGFEAQVNWAGTSGLTTSSDWYSSGTRSLHLMKDLSSESSPHSVIFQTYPAEGVDVADVTTLSVDVYAVDAGDSVTFKLWAKDQDGVWRDAGATPLNGGALTLSIDVSDLDVLQGFGVQIENFDTSATAAKFYFDKVAKDSTVAHDFEPQTSGFETQVDWSTVPGISVTDDWSTSGNQALTVYHDVTQLDGAANIIIQTYPANGIDVSGVSMLQVSAHAIGSGSNTTIKLWAKDQDGVWRDAGATAVSSDGLELSIDVSDLDQLQGFGLQIENFDSAATDAKFYMDNVRLDDEAIFDFENTDGWEFQVNWSPVPGLQLSDVWMVTGDASLSGKTQLVDDDDNVILQTYPAGGLTLGDVSTLHVTAYAMNAGDNVSAQLFVKDQDGVWRDGGAVTLSGEAVTLSVDISDFIGVQGFGVRFQGAVNSTSESQYFIDNVVFE